VLVRATIRITSAGVRDHVSNPLGIEHQQGARVELQIEIAVGDVEPIAAGAQCNTHREVDSISRWFLPIIERKTSDQRKAHEAQSALHLRAGSLERIVANGAGKSAHWGKLIALGKYASELSRYE
jgi:hypothetical protein